MIHSMYIGICQKRHHSISNNLNCTYNLYSYKLLQHTTTYRNRKKKISTYYIIMPWNARNVSGNPAKACPAWQSWQSGNPGNLAIQQSGNPGNPGNPAILMLSRVFRLSYLKLFFYMLTSLPAYCQLALVFLAHAGKLIGHFKSINTYRQNAKRLHYKME